MTPEDFEKEIDATFERFYERRERRPGSERAIFKAEVRKLFLATLDRYAREMRR